MDNERNKVLSEAEKELDIALGNLENAFDKLVTVGFIENGDSGLRSANSSYERIDFSAIVSLRNHILEELGEI